MSLPPRGGVNDQWNNWLLPRITGNFTGTTDEIIQWAAAKWGVSDEMIRAQMISESTWFQGLLDGSGRPINGRGYGDFENDQRYCAAGYSAPCPSSFGISQIKHTAHPGTFPYSRDSTAMNLDYLAASLRGCYEGWEEWLNYSGQYRAGDIDGCIGRWYSGEWHSDSADYYTAGVHQRLHEKPWLQFAF
jgi:autotransporter family porin